MRRCGPGRVSGTAGTGGRCRAQGARCRNLIAPVRLVLADGANVRVGELGGVQRHQVSVGAQVRLEVVDRLAVAADAEGQLRFLPGGEAGEALELDDVSVGVTLERGRRKRDAAHRPGRGQIRPEDVLATVCDEVGDCPVRAGVRDVQLDREGSVGPEGWMQGAGSPSGPCGPRSGEAASCSRGRSGGSGCRHSR
jgi:hypothetical protein